MNILKSALIGSITFVIGTVITNQLPANAQVNQTLGQCITDIRKSSNFSINSNEAANLCTQNLKFQLPLQSMGQCITDVRKSSNFSINSDKAGQLCQYLLQQQAQNSNRNFDQNRPNSTPSNVQLGGSPQAIEDCIKRLMYERKPVCTRGRCARLRSPEDNANRGFGGWQWQTVRTSMSESSAVRACQNAR